MDHASRPQPFPLRLFAGLFVGVALLILGGAWYIATQRIEAELDGVRTHEIGNVIMGVRRLDDELRQPFQHLRTLAREPAVVAGDVPAMATLFARLIAYYPGYDKVRWIDAAGREVVRVNNRAGEAEVVPAARLQTVAGAYYVERALRLAPGQVFVSPLDLNLEHGQVARPLQPMLRLAMPLADQAGRTRGVLVLNVAARGLLTAYTEALLDSRDHAMLLNEEGYWLSAPDSGDAWGFALGRPEATLARQAPAAWRAIAAMPAGQQELADGLWTWSTVYPLKVEDSRDVAGIPHWLAVSHLPANQLALIRQDVWTLVGASAAVLLALFAGLAAWLARALDGRAHALAAAARAHAEAAAATRLSEVRRRFELAVEANATGLLVVDGDGRVVLANPALERMFGYQRGELIGQSMEVLLPPDERARHGQFRQGYLRDPVPRPMGAGRELHGLRKDGGVLPVEISLSAFMEEGRRYVDAVVVDITERKRAEERLRRGEARLRLLWETNPNGLLVVDEAGRIQMTNPALDAMFGYAAGELAGQEVDVLLPEASRARHAELRRDYLAAPGIRAMGPGRTLRGRRRDGGLFAVEVGLAHFEEDGRLYVQATVVALPDAG